MNCKIVRDLMILHIDNQASPESIDEIEKHIKDCDECRRIYEKLFCECGHSDDPEKPADETCYKENTFNPFAKIRFQFRLRIIIAVIITAVFIGAVGVYFLWHYTGKQRRCNHNK